jgi:hypothetical protein
VTRVECDGRGDHQRRALARGFLTQTYARVRRAKNYLYDPLALANRGWHYHVLPVGVPVGDTDPAGHRLLSRLVREAALRSGDALPDARHAVYAAVSCAAIRCIAAAYSARGGGARLPTALLAAPSAAARAAAAVPSGARLQQ